jgi:subtilase family serine protease
MFAFVQVSLGELLQVQKRKQERQSQQKMKVFVKPSASTLNPSFSPATFSGGQLAALYSVPSVLPSLSSSNSKRVTIALIVAFHSPTLFTDLVTFLSDPANTSLPIAIQMTSATTASLGSSGGTVRQINLNSKTVRATSNSVGWNQEESLDLQACVSMNPAANIVVIEAISDSSSDLAAAITYAKNVVVADIVSMSWGGSDTSANTPYNSVMTPRPGQGSGPLYLAASGDQNAVSWPAVLPACVAVGGASLSWTPTPSAPLQSTHYTWSSAGCGFSYTQAKPSFQASVNPGATRRAIPDVSVVASDYTAFSTFNASNGGWNSVGGTSLSCPLVAGMLSLFLQKQFNLHNGTSAYQGTAAFLSLLYNNPALLCTPIVNGNDEGSTPTGGLIDYNTSSSSNYNIPTGLGVPNLSTLLALVS